MHVAPIAPELLDTIRTHGADESGNRLHSMTAGGGEPLRCCLREADPGEPIALIAHRPFSLPGPYAETGPVFVHAVPCDGYADTTDYPVGFRQRRQVFRAYGPDGSIADAVLHEPEGDAEAALDALLARPDVAFVHSRNVLYGCFMFEVRPQP